MQENAFSSKGIQNTKIKQQGGEACEKEKEYAKVPGRVRRQEHSE